jgi:hypothetical protein
LRSAPETREAIGIVGDGGEADLDRDVAIQGPVAGAIDLAHTPGRQWRDGLTAAEACARLQRSQGVAASICGNSGTRDPISGKRGRV